jgi:hypothetical protein
MFTLRSQWVGLVCVLVLGCQSAGQIDGQESVREIVPAGDAGHMHGVASGGAVWTSGLPSREDLDLARRRGIEVAIDVSTEQEADGHDVASVCAELGIEYVTMHCDTRERVCGELVDHVLSELRQRAHEPVLLFSGDSSRAAMLLAIHRIVDDRLPLERALVEARRAGMKPGHPEIFVRSQVLRLESRS